MVVSRIALVQAARCRRDEAYKQHRPVKNKLEPADALKYDD